MCCLTLDFIIDTCKDDLYIILFCKQYFAIIKPTAAAQEKDLIVPQLDEYIKRLVEEKICQTEEKSEARIKDAESKILALREEMLLDRAKLETLEAKAEDKRRKRRERKARKKSNTEPEPVPEKRPRRNSTNTGILVGGPSLEEPRFDNRAEWEHQMELDNPGLMA